MEIILRLSIFSETLKWDSFWEFWIAIHANKITICPFKDDSLYRSFPLSQKKHSYRKCALVWHQIFKRMHFWSAFEYETRLKVHALQLTKNCVIIAYIDLVWFVSSFKVKIRLIAYEKDRSVSIWKVFLTPNSSVGRQCTDILN